MVVRCAEALLDRGHEVLVIISENSSVIQWANEKSIRCVKELSILDTLGEFDYLFSAVNTKMLSPEIVKRAKKMSINFHDSLLPRYAGIHSPAWAIMNQEKFHGISWHIIETGPDKGDILKQVKILIDPNETSMSLNLKCYEQGIKLFIELIDELVVGAIQPVPQDLNFRTYWGRHKKPRINGFIDWHLPAAEISSLVRALNFGNHRNTFSSAKVIIDKEVYLVKNIRELKGYSGKEPGTIIKASSHGIKVSTKTNDIELTELENLKGDRVSIKDLEINHLVLPSLDGDKSISEVLSRNEEFWINQLVSVTNWKMPITSLVSSKINHLKTGPSFLLDHRFEDIFTGINFEKYVLSSVILFLSRISSESRLSLELRYPELLKFKETDLVCQFVPFNIDLDSSMDLYDLFATVQTRFDLLRDRIGFLKDIVARYPELKGQRFNFPVTVEIIDTRKEILPGGLIHFVICRDDASVQIYLNDQDFEISQSQRETILMVMKSFQSLVLSIKDSNNCLIKDLSLLLKNEQDHIITDYGGEIVEYQSNKKIIQIIEDCVDQAPDHIALRFSEKTMTYQELDNRANQLAHYLQCLSVGPNIFVGIFMDRSFEMIISVLAVLKAGGAYVPLDPSYPRERLNFLCSEIAAPVILTQQHLSHYLAEFGGKLVMVDQDPELDTQLASRLINTNQSEDMAYMIYTSGSTGRPKGCPNSHKNIENYLQFVKSFHPMLISDRLLFRTPYTFDVSVPEILYPLMCGASIVIAEPHRHGDPSYLVQTILEESITEIGFVPSLLQVFLEAKDVERCQSLKVVTAIGEILTLETVKKFKSLFPKTRLINSYGPTEAAVAVTYWECSSQDETVPIGYPIPNNKIYILDESGQIVPVGTFGELYIGGRQVAQDYWKRPDLSKVRFIPDRFSELPGARMYRTGDRARFLPGGMIEYQGRMDFQVKIRGFRIEPGEIESVLLEHPGVSQCVVVAKRINKNLDSLSLVSYIVEKYSINPEELISFLKSRLPDYMIPNGIIKLEKMPIITSGKIDRVELIKREDQFPREAEAPTKTLNKIESDLVKIWEGVLAVEGINLFDNFFSLGGDSLKAVRVVVKIEQSSGIKVPLNIIFQAPTIQELAEYISSK